MSNEATTVSVTMTVEAALERAFEYFTVEMPSWWNDDHHIIEAPFERMVFEPRVGGNIYDVGADGSECRWSRILAYEPPRRLVFSWDITTDWKLETDPTKASEVEVRFEPEGESRTRIELEHRNLDRHGDGWEGMRDGVGSPGGWPALGRDLRGLLREADARRAQAGA
jgi:uncharacterized protein YndB with AHSA1/START domain